MAETRRERKCFFPLPLKRRARQSPAEPRRHCPHRAPHKPTAHGRTCDASQTFFFFQGCARLWQRFQSQGQGDGLRGSGSAPRRPSTAGERPGTAARAGARASRGRAGARPARKRGDGGTPRAPFGVLQPRPIPRPPPAGTSRRGGEGPAVPTAAAVPGRAPPPGSGRAALTQADGSERCQRALTELRGRCLLHGGSLSPALQRGGNRGGSAPFEPLRRAAGVGGAAGPRCARPPGSRERSGRRPRRRPHGRAAPPLRGRWRRTDRSAAAAAPRDRPAERLRRPGRRQIGRAHV